LREVRLALLEADVALPVVKEFTTQVKQAALGQEVLGSLTPGQALIGIVHRELTKLMGETQRCVESHHCAASRDFDGWFAGCRQDDHEWKAC
jgi:signal recognition particle GTPase